MSTPRRRAERPAERRILGGVAAGIADHLGVPVVWVRVGFVVATWFNGAGLIAYLLLWRFMPLTEPERAPGMEAAQRRGLRVGGAVVGTREILQTVAIVAVGVGVLVVLQVRGRGVSTAVLLPILAAIVGVVVVWRQLDEASLSDWVRRSSGASAAVRIAAGLGLVVVAAVYFVTQERGWSALVDLASASTIALIGAALILGPWVASLLADLTRERRERVRSQERADVAAHLHDSVLQTLALLQRNAGDPAAVATLARRQERDLRAWLYGEESPRAGTFAALLRAAADDVEEAHRVPVELVMVGDAPASVKGKVSDLQGSLNNLAEETGRLSGADDAGFKNAAGKVENWSFQAYSPVTLRRNGTDRQVFLDNIGKEVWVRGCVAKNGTPRAAAAGTLKFSDGELRQVGQLQD